MATPFAALVRAIIFQQLASRAAEAIHGRFLGNFPDGLTPVAVSQLPEAIFREAGLSGAKTISVKDLVAKAVDGTVPLDSLDSHSDEDIIERLVRVRGVGRWTAEMFLIFQLGRPDVWPVDDLGVRKGYAIIHGMTAPPAPRELVSRGDILRPFRSIAAWYCWRAKDSVVPGTPNSIEIAP